ncbi:TonB-dependent receptor domain-containing protein [Aestuariibaculum sediminum]|uniref:TonB-dependent receptor n=1 Tax=Aestuariibaculum sediminum TaxID=2770637 RepID=A0A8J6QFB4_9FLAO|nr:TonB-dependent receptor [Aestuariibaculum sediminum]MBD0831039.1 TonB-dependent receptor [Aestuariibaculum sediminum]
MNKLLLILLLSFVFAYASAAQQAKIKGRVKDNISLQYVEGVTVAIEKTNISTTTDNLGVFVLSDELPLGEHLLIISKVGYITKRFPIVINPSKMLDLSGITLEQDTSIVNDMYTIVLTDDELDDDTGGADNISGLLSASLDVFQRTAAFEFSASFFRLRGLDSDMSLVSINGIEMNKMYSGRPQWSNWGGLNAMVRQQEFSSGLMPSFNNFGNVLGTTNINTRASHYREGGQVTYSSSNRSYTNRLMINYATGSLKNNWALAIMFSRRWGNEGFQDATLYDANSFFISAEKNLNKNHSLNLTAIYAPNKRGKSSPNTQEVYDLKGIKYNEYWGWQQGNKRNSRIKNVEEPIFIFSHYWDISSKSHLNTNVAYQFGKVGNSRLDYGGTRLNNDGVPIGGGANPSPSYYQKLPSYWLAQTPEANYENAYLSEQEFLNYGQIDWNHLYQTNYNNTQANASYVLYEDRNDDTQLSLNSGFQTELNGHVSLNASINYKRLESENYAEVIDLLGGNGVLNVDAFDGFQYDLQQPNKISKEGDTFKYNYNFFANLMSGYVQGKFNYKTIDFYLAATVSKTNYQREGVFDNEANAGNSVGKSDPVHFTGFGFKAGLTYKYSGKHILKANLGYMQRPPSLRNTFSNARVNNNVVPQIKEEKIKALDFSYIYRSPIVKSRLTGFYIKTEDANEIAFYYADGVTGFEGTSEFVSEIIQGIDKSYLGLETGIEAKITSTFKLKAAVSYGQYLYANNPSLTLSSNSISVNQGQANLKNYRLASGPQHAYSFGFEYRDPNYWWLGATANYFTNTYLDISPITRTSNFYKNPEDGLPFNDYDESVARELLKQEQFDNYMVVNLVGGKSWRIDSYYVGFFASVGNVLDKVYKTGGFEQGRSANYRELKEDVARDKRVFGPKYWYGRGTNYFLNLYFRF